MRPTNTIYIPDHAVMQSRPLTVLSKSALWELQGLLELSKKYPIIDIRGRGLMVAVEFGEQRSVDGSYTAKPGCAAAVTKAAQKRNMILLTAGQLPLSLIVLSDVFAGHSHAWLGCAVPVIQ